MSETREVYQSEDEPSQKYATVTVVGTELSTIRVCSPVEWDEVVRLAGRAGMAEFTIATPRTPVGNAKNLTKTAFPYNGDVVVFEHNTAKKYGRE